MLTIGKILIILTLITPLLIGSLLGSIASFVGGSNLGSFLPGGAGAVASGVTIGAGIWLLLTFIASIFILIHVTHM
jgi:hypothetical protein